MTVRARNPDGRIVPRRETRTRRRTSLENTVPLRLVLVLAAAMALPIACASRSYEPTPPESLGLFDRLETQQEGGLTVRAVVPSEAETEAIFGLPLYRRGIQPIWLEITNETEERVRYAPVGTDAEYFPAHEVWYMHKGKYKGDADREIEHHLHAETMPRWVWPGETRSGWVFTHLAEGTKAFNVDVFQGSGRHQSFSFFIDVPGRAPDHAAIDFQTLYEEAAIAAARARRIPRGAGSPRLLHHRRHGRAARPPDQRGARGPGPRRAEGPLARRLLRTPARRAPRAGRARAAFRRAPARRRVPDAALGSR